MNIVLVHLSDMHLRTSKDRILENAGKIGAAAFAACRSAEEIFVVLSGDVAYSGKRAEYDLAHRFLAAIRDELAAEVKKKISFVLVPGNHDCNFDEGNKTRDVLIEHVVGGNEDVDASVIDACTAVQREFFAFREALSPSARDADKLWRTVEFYVGNKRILFDEINVSWVSQLSEKPGKLAFPVARYSQKKSDESDLRIAVLHHPLNWFSQTSYRAFRTFVRRIADIVVTGHEHQGTVGVINDAESEESAYVEGCVLQVESTDVRDSSFNVVQIDLDKRQFCASQYVWSGSHYAPKEKGSWIDYHNLPKRQTSEFPIEDAFAAILDDPGAYLLHGDRRQITLGDIYVLPNLQRIERNLERQRQVNASKFLRPEAIEKGVLIEGDEKSGRTSLLRYLYLSYHSRGFVPLLLRGNDLLFESVASVESTISKAVVAQYGADKRTAFEQLSRAKKVLLLDDLERSPVRAPAARSSMLCTLRDRFGYMVLTASELFNFREMIEGDASASLRALEHYRLQQFGFVLRSQLTQKWFSQSADSSVSGEEFSRRCERAEKLMDTVMAKSLIPRAPLYLLTLLQSIDAGRSGDFKDSALGHYYHYLIAQSFQREGAQPEKLTEHYQYCAHMAWFFHTRGAEELPEDALREFNQHFSTQFHTVDFRTRIDFLVRAKVLRDADGAFSFRYPYIFYFLKGLYLSQNISTPEIRSYVKRCCEHLYVRDNANTVLFLVHHTNERFVLESLSNTLAGLFAEREPIKFEGDTGGIAKLIDSAPSLVYEGGEPADHKRKRDELRDQTDDKVDGLLDAEENGSGLSLLARITMLFKTSEILGQVLKNQYARIPRTEKVSLLRELFNSQLRALRDFLLYCEKNPEVLEVTIDAELRKREVTDDAKRKSLAKKIVASLIEMVSFSFLARAADCVGSDDLAEDIESTVRSENTIAFRIIRLAVSLDSPIAIQKQRLLELYRDCDGELLAKRLLKIFVIRHLYFYRTSEKHIQWLAEKLDLDIGAQHKMAYQNQGKRRLK